MTSEQGSIVLAEAPCVRAGIVDVKVLPVVAVLPGLRGAVGSKMSPSGRVGHRLEIHTPVAFPAGDALSAHGFEQALEGRLARFKWPQRVEFLQALPTTALGKVARAPLRVQLLALGSPDAPPSPTAS